jgi:hypothetical protein
MTSDDITNMRLLVSNCIVLWIVVKEEALQQQGTLEKMTIHNNKEFASVHN